MRILFSHSDALETMAADYLALFLQSNDTRIASACIVRSHLTNIDSRQIKAVVLDWIKGKQADSYLIMAKRWLVQWHISDHSK